MQSARDQIKSRLPIADVLSTYLTLIPAGNQLKAKCPFHNEKTASFSVSPDRGLYYCFGCGAKGDIFTFVEQFEGVDFKGALKILADRAGIALSAYNGEKDDFDPIYEVLEIATQAYVEELSKHPDALAYLKKRGITEDTIESFRLGYAPSEWRYLATKLPEGQIPAADRAGLVKKTEKGYYDRFRGRITFPMNDSSSRVVAFSARSFPDTPEGPKYLNSPETEVFQKSRILYGFDKAKAHIKKHNFAILVEGQMDMVLSHQYGFKNTVATSGTAVSDTAAGDPGAQLAVLSRLTPNLFLAFDGDSAGEKALARAALVALSLGLNPKVVPLPSGIDPADFLSQNGADAWKELLKQSEHFILHKLGVIKKQATSAHLLVRTIRSEIFPFLARVISPIEQKLYMDAIAKDLGIGTEEIAKELQLFKANEPVQTAVVEKVSEKTTPILSAGERFLALVERYGGDELTAQKNALVSASFNEEKLTLPEMDEAKMALSMVLVEREYGMLDEEDLIKGAKELAAQIVSQFYDKLRAQYAAKLKDAERNGAEEEIEILLATLHTLNSHRHDT